MELLESILQTFSNREKALTIWVCVLFIYILLKKEVRSSLFQALRMMFLSKLVIVFIGTIAYTALISFMLKKVGLWNILLLKDTAFWILGTAFVLLMGIDKATRDSTYFKKFALSIFALSIIIEFIVNLYTFNFWVEMLLVPVFVFIGGILSLAETDPKYRIVKKFLNSTLVTFGIFSILYVLTQLVNSITTFVTLYNLRTFLISPILSLGYIPFLYLFTLYIVYETLFVRINIFTKKNKALAVYGKWEIFKLCNLHLSRLIQFVQQTGIEIARISSKDDINRIINDFRSKLKEN